MNAKFPRSLPISIVGGGISGLALGIGLLKRGIAVRLFEASSYPRHRMCGEFLNGVSGETLSTLGIADTLTDAQRHTQTRWFRNGKQVHKARLPRPALAVSRYVLDHRMAQRFSALGGDLAVRSRKKPEPCDGLVWATGRPVQKQEGGRNQRHWIGLKCHIRNLGNFGGLEMHLGSGTYAGLAPIGAGLVNLCGLFTGGVAFRRDSGSETMLAMLRAHGFGELAARVANAEIVDGSTTGAAGFQFGRQAPPPGICSLGDAGAIIPPFTGNGMSMALEAAESALAPLEAYAHRQLSWPEACSMVAGLLEKRFRTRLRVARIIHPLMLNPLGQRVLTGFFRTGLVPFRLVHSLLT